MMAMRSADQENIRPSAKVGTRAAATQVAAKIEIGQRAEQPRRVLGQHHLLAHQAEQVAIGLNQAAGPGGAAAAP